MTTESWVDCWMFKCKQCGNEHYIPFADIKAPVKIRCPFHVESVHEYERYRHFRRWAVLSPAYHHNKAIVE